MNTATMFRKICDRAVSFGCLSPGRYRTPGSFYMALPEHEREAMKSLRAEDIQSPHYSVMWYADPSRRSTVFRLGAKATPQPAAPFAGSEQP